MALLEKVHIQGDTNFIGALNKAAKSCNQTQFIVFWANHLISKISRQIALKFENISCCCSFSSQRKFFVMKFFHYVRYKLDTDSNKMRSKYLRNFFWGGEGMCISLYGISACILFISKMAWIFLIKFWDSHGNFLICEIFVHARIVIARCYIAIIHKFPDITWNWDLY